MFIQEMNLMKKIRHPNLVGLLAVVTKSSPNRIILEYLPGGALSEWLLLNPGCELMDRLSIIHQIALGMHALGEFKIIHRDLAARNILVGIDIVVKVADYGLSREQSGDKEYYKFKENSNLPLRWTAPEVITHLKWDLRSDIYAYGVVIWEVYSPGALPFELLTDTALITLLVQHPNLGKLLHDKESIYSCPGPVTLLSCACLERLPENRPTFKSIIVATLPELWDELVLDIDI